MTTEARPGAATAVFGDRLALADGLVGHLVTSGVERGLVGPREVARMWTRHVLNCAVLAELVPPSARVVDIGSGAGLPGLALAIARPDLDILLVEPLERRVQWLQEVAADLGLPVTVHRERAEGVAGEISGHVVTARAVAPLPRLLGWALPLVEPGGQVLAIKGRTAEAELADSSDLLDRWNITGAEVVSCGAAVLDVPTTVVRIPVGTGARPARAGGGRRRRRG